MTCAIAWLERGGTTLEAPLGGGTGADPPPIRECGECPWPSREGAARPPRRQPLSQTRLKKPVFLAIGQWLRSALETTLRHACAASRAEDRPRRTIEHNTPLVAGSFKTLERARYARVGVADESTGLPSTQSAAHGVPAPRSFSSETSATSPRIDQRFDGEHATLRASVEDREPRAVRRLLATSARRGEELARSNTRQRAPAAANASVRKLVRAREATPVWSPPLRDLRVAAGLNHDNQLARAAARRRT